MSEPDEVGGLHRKFTNVVGMIVLRNFKIAGGGDGPGNIIWNIYFSATDKNAGYLSRLRKTIPQFRQKLPFGRRAFWAVVYCCVNGVDTPLQRSL